MCLFRLGRNVIKFYFLDEYKIISEEVTNNFPRRYEEHNKNWFFKADRFEMTPVAYGLTKENARALEQILICVYSIDGIENQINSIARRNWGKFTKNFIRMSFLIIGGFAEE